MLASKRNAKVSDRIIILKTSINTIKQVIRIIRFSCEKCDINLIIDVFIILKTLWVQKNILVIIIISGHKGKDIKKEDSPKKFLIKNL